jgi:hypothetical protein
MLRRIAVAALALLVVAAVASAAETKGGTVKGTVKTVAANSIVVTDSDAKDWTFLVDSKETTVFVKGAHHKLDKLKADGKQPTISEFVAEKQQVSVKYEKSPKQEGYWIAKEVHVAK